MNLPPFESFFEENKDVVYRYLLLRGRREDVDDCFQETFLSALRAYPRLQDGSHLRAWVLKIAERKVIDAARQRARSPSPAPDVPDVASSDAPELDPDLWRAVRDLPPKQQAAVALRFIGDLPYADIASSLGTSEDAARQNVRQGLRKLRKVWSR